MSRNTQNRSLKNDVINGYGFWNICLPKTDTSAEIWDARYSGMVLHVVRLFENFGNIVFCKRLYTN